MIYTSENNWYRWYYNGVPFSRQTGNAVFSTSFSCKYQATNRSFKEEMLAASSSILDHYPGITPSVLFSGGADSELTLRSFLELGIKPRIFIFRYENDYNIYDVSYAVTICSMLNVDYTIVDINLIKFFENEAERLSEIAQTDRARSLHNCKFLEYVDELPIIGAGDLNVHRKTDDYSYQGEWAVRCDEYEIGWDKVLVAMDKPGVAQWFRWTPGLVYSFINTNWFQRLTNDGYPRKLGTNSTKILGYREAYPDMLSRVKKTGFEKIESVILEFENYLQEKNNGLIYRQYHERIVPDILIEMQK